VPVLRRRPHRERREGAVSLPILNGAQHFLALAVEQQVDTPINEPPLEEMEADDARVIARGDFYEIDRRGDGTASVYRLGNGRLALRLDGFKTAAETDPVRLA
jgi:hypothetical protein